MWFECLICFLVVDFFDEVHVRGFMKNHRVGIPCFGFSYQSATLLSLHTGLKSCKD